MSRDRYDDALNRYLADIGQYPLLSEEDETRLSRKIQESRILQENLESGHQLSFLEMAILDAGQDAQDTLVRHNLRLVVSIAKSFFRDSLPLLDLISEGNGGLMHAASKFDATQGRFATYAGRWIRQRLMKYTVEHGYATRVPPHRSASIHRVAKVRRQLMQRLSREPTPGEIAEMAGEQYTEEHVLEVMKIMQNPLELDMPVRSSEGGQMTIGSFMGESVDEAQARVDNLVEGVHLRDVVAAALGVLTVRERTILEMLFGLGDFEVTHPKDVARSFGLTQERIRQIKKEAFSKIASAGLVRDLLDVD